MTGKELVRASLERKPAGRVPFDVYEGWMWPGVRSRLMESLGAADYEDLLCKLGASCRWESPACTGIALPPDAKARVASPHTTDSLNGAIWGLGPGVREHGLESSGHPLAGARSPGDLAGYPWPSAGWFDYEGLARRAGACRESFVVVGGFTPLFYLMADLCGMEKLLMDMAVNPALVDALVGHIVGFYREYFGEIARRCRGLVDALAFGDDFASQSATLMSPQLWRRFFKPAWGELFALARQHGYKAMFHSCGSVYALIPDLIDVGLDMLYPVQPRARSMDLATLKSEFGGSLSFYGGVDTQELLPHGTPEEVRAEVRRLMGLFAGEGGYVLATSHVIMDDVPLENVIALYGEAAAACASQHGWVDTKGGRA